MKKVNIETGLPTHEDSKETIIEAFVEGMLPEKRRVKEKEEPSSTTGQRHVSKGKYKFLNVTSLQGKCQSIRKVFSKRKFQ